MNVWTPGDLNAPWELVVAEGTEPAWESGISVTVGMVVTHNGHRWEARLAHTTHAGWEPSINTHAVWTDLGPA